ncbi:hypothetical protein ES703_19884 [subsurface metagenome]
MNDEVLHEFIYGRRPDVELKLALSFLPISPMHKKYAWSAYCTAAGKKITREDILDITGGIPL